jgi:putative acetyltransferase
VTRVRAELPSDHERVFAINAAAFGRPDEARLVSALRSSASPRISLVAEVDAEVVGHVFFSPVTIESPSAAPPVAGLAPVAVDPEHQGRGAGSKLVRAGLRRCPARGWRAVFVVGDPAYYSRFGFVRAAPMGFTYDERFDPVLQVIELTPGALDRCRGRVRYHPAFAETGTG